MRCFADVVDPVKSNEFSYFHGGIIAYNKRVITKKCVNCGNNFPVAPEDINFYKKVDAPEPVECYNCRQQRRLAYRNERILYPRKCDLCNKNFLSIYSADKTYPVYCADCWWSDNWDSMEYGRDYDFNKPFFEQWENLWDSVPKLGIITMGESINSNYTNDAMKLQNCYLVFDGEQAKDCYYGETFYLTVDCSDFLTLKNSELCYEAINSYNCYNCSFIRFCKDCAESNFLVDCIGCKNCFFCANLKQKQYCIFNKQYARDEYFKKIADINLADYKQLQKVKLEFEKFIIPQPKKASRGIQNENISGDNVDNSKDSFYSFDSMGMRDCKFCTNVILGANDCYDIDIWGNNLELSYNCECIGAGANSIFYSYYAGFNANNIYYSALVWQGAHDMFGCVALKHKEFCILNKQYSGKKYRELFSHIVAHMKHTGEWGQFFPINTSAFGYNESVAQDFFPLTREQALKKGYNWREKDKREYQKQTYKIPDDLKNVPNSITNEILACESCGKNYKITSQELEFYRKKFIPTPHKCYLCRHFDRLHMRNPRRLYSRFCKKCNVSVQSSYAPERPEPIYCEKCYLEVI